MEVFLIMQTVLQKLIIGNIIVACKDYWKRSLNYSPVVEWIGIEYNPEEIITIEDKEYERGYTTGFT